MPEINPEKCDFCGGCVAVCKNNAITVYFNHWEVDKDLCSECLICKKVCPMDAISKTKKLKLN